MSGIVNSFHGAVTEHSTSQRVCWRALPKASVFIWNTDALAASAQFHRLNTSLSPIVRSRQCDRIHQTSGSNRSVSAAAGSSNHDIIRVPADDFVCGAAPSRIPMKRAGNRSQCRLRTQREDRPAAGRIHWRRALQVATRRTRQNTARLLRT